MICGSVAKGKALRRSGARLMTCCTFLDRLVDGSKARHRASAEFGRKLVGVATACMDISDGLALDLHDCARNTGVAAELDKVPLLKGATLDQALHDGEDYELLYTAPPRVKAPGVPIGRDHKGKPGAVRSGKYSLPLAMITPEKKKSLN